MSLVNNCMIVNLRLGIWTGHRLDKAASSRLTEDANADDGAARVNKHLISKAAMAGVTKAASAVRTHFYDSTLPWKDNGDRIISRKAYIRFMDKYDRLATAFNAEVDRFCSEVYPAEVDRAGFRMGDLFNPADYPAASSIRQRFYVDLGIDPVAQAKDFRVDLSKAEVATIRQQIETATGERLSRAMAAVWARLADVLGNFLERTQQGTGIRVELTQNIREIVDILPEMNIVDDPQLESIRQMIDAKLTGYEAAELRTSDAARTAAAADAQEIMDRMRGFMAAFGPAA